MNQKRPEVKIRKAHPDVPDPVYSTPGAAGCDVFAIENTAIFEGCSILIHTGLFLEVPEGYECQIRPRSGLAVKNGITVANSPGTLDSDYRGELMVCLINHSHKEYRINRGDRIAQLVFAPVVQATFVNVDELSETERGSGGFGSTGQ